jgi:hypothetical protein
MDAEGFGYSEDGGEARIVFALFDSTDGALAQIGHAGELLLGAPPLLSKLPNGLAVSSRS